LWNTCLATLLGGLRGSSGTTAFVSAVSFSPALVPGSGTPSKKKLSVRYLTASEHAVTTHEARRDAANAATPHRAAEEEREL
jgi:hypothetical protein